MTETRDDDHAYFQHLERVFIGLRGAPLLLSPSDWQVARSWHRAGIPLELVEATLREVFERRLSEGKEDRVNSLRYLKSAVTRAWREHQKHLASAAEAPPPASIDLAARLGRLARAIPDGFEDAEEMRQRVVALTGDIEQVEAGLTAFDQELLERAEAGLDAEGRALFAASLEATHAALGVRLPAGELDRADAPLRRHVLRRQLGLPVLSLFAQEALGDSVEPASSSDLETG